MVTDVVKPLYIYKIPLPHDAEAWFRKALKEWKHRVPSKSLDDYDYIQIVPGPSWEGSQSGNDGMQAWRHRGSGYAFPDYCRLMDGRPEIWAKDDFPEVAIKNPLQILHHLVVDYSDEEKFIRRLLRLEHSKQ